MVRMNRRIRQATRKDVPEVLDVIYQAHLPDEEDAREVRDSFAYYYNFSEYPPERIAVAEVDGKIVSMAGVIPFPVQKEGFHVKAAQLNPVMTLQEYRRRGLASGCINFLCDLLKKQGYSIFFVAGVPGFYPRLGFHPVLDGFEGSIPSHRLKSLQLEAQVRQARMEDAERILHIYQSTPGKNLFSIHRDRQWIRRKILDWKRDFLPIGTIHVKNILLSTKDGCCGSYAFVKEGTHIIHIEEIKAVSREHLLSLLKAVGEMAMSKEINEIEIDHTVPGESLYPLVLDLGGRITVSTKYSHMLKILSVKSSLFSSMQQTFQKRIAESEWNSKSFSLTMESHEEKVTFANRKELHIFPGGPKGNPEPTIKISAEVLTHLIAGHRTIYELIGNGSCPDYGETVNSILHTLFPKQYPYVYGADLN